MGSLGPSNTTGRTSTVTLAKLTPETGRPEQPGQPGRAIPFVDLTAQHAALAAEIRSALTRVMESGWFVLGPEVEGFEQEFASIVGTKHAVGVASGTDAMTLALLSLGVGPGDDVITSPMTATFTALAISRTGAKPVFADVDPATLNLAPRSVAEKIGPRTKAILPVHLYGSPSEMPALLELADEKEIPVVEDACQAHGAVFAGRPVGGWGRAGCFSFYPTKNLGALGDGGLVTTNDPELAARVRRLRNGGQSDRYVHEEVGFNSRLDELQAAVLRAKLPHLPGWNERRRDLAARYREALREMPLVWVEALPDTEPATHLLVARAPERDRFRETLSEAGVKTLIHYPVPAHLQPAYRSLGQGEGACPEAERAAQEVVSLPLYPELDDSQVERVVREVKSFYR